MSLARRTRNRLCIAVVVCAACVLAAVAAAALFPRKGRSFLQSVAWWLAAIPIGFAACLVVEFAGSWTLERPFWQGLPSWARVMLLVVVICACAVAAVLVARIAGIEGRI